MNFSPSPFTLLFLFAFALSLMYLWALDHIPELTGLNREGWVPALKLVGLWQPDVARAMVPMACILVINCLVLNLPGVVEILSPLDRADDEDRDEIPKERSGTKPPGEGGAVTWEAFWALATSAAAEVWLTTVRLVDGCGAWPGLMHWSKQPVDTTLWGRYYVGSVTGYMWVR